MDRTVELKIYQNNNKCNNINVAVFVNAESEAAVWKLLMGENVVCEKVIE